MSSSDHKFRHDREWPMVMVDIETTGLRPDRNHVFQVAMVFFNLEKRTVNPNSLNIRIAMDMHHRAWDEGTRDFWMGKNRQVYGEIMEMPVMSSKDAVRAISEFVRTNCPEGNVSFVGKPSHFDFPFIDSYFKDSAVPIPFHFREVTDMNTWAISKLEDYVSGATGNDILFKFMYKNVESISGGKHNAVIDALYQIKCMFWVKDFTEGKVKPAVNGEMVYNNPYKGE